MRTSQMRTHLTVSAMLKARRWDCGGCSRVVAAGASAAASAAAAGPPRACWLASWTCRAGQHLIFIYLFVCDGGLHQTRHASSNGICYDIGGRGGDNLTALWFVPCSSKCAAVLCAMTYSDASFVCWH